MEDDHVKGSRIRKEESRNGSTRRTKRGKKKELRNLKNCVARDHRNQMWPFTTHRGEKHLAPASRTQSP